MEAALKNIKFEELVTKGTKYAQENPAVVGASAAVAVLASLWIFRKADMERDGNDYGSQLTGGMKILNNKDHNLKGGEFDSSIKEYEGLFSGARQSTGAITSDESVEHRKERYQTMINHFYNLVTDFYEWGWGQSFHFGPRFHSETFMESIKRAEYYLALRLGLKHGMRVLDLGCGVGGPMRNIAVFSGAQIDGITINNYQVKIGNKYNANNGLSHLCKLNQGDFQDLPWDDNTFDACFEIEATCHSPDRVVTFKGVHRCLKPGGVFAGYDWVMLPHKYDPKNKDHVRIKEGIEVGNGLPTLATPDHIVDCLEKAGFEVLDHFDVNGNLHAANEIPWYEPLNGSFSLSGFRMTYLGRLCTHSMVWTLELLRIAPAGSTRVSALLNATALDLCEGGKLEIFTPSYFFLAKAKK